MRAGAGNLVNQGPRRCGEGKGAQAASLRNEGHNVSGEENSVVTPERVRVEIVRKETEVFCALERVCPAWPLGHQRIAGSARGPHHDAAQPAAHPVEVARECLA